MATTRKYNSFTEFYKNCYIIEHSNATNKRLHVVGTSLSIILTLYLVTTGQFKYMYSPLLVGYSFAWVGHFVFQKNKPATFKHPIWSFYGDFVMLYKHLIGEYKF